jgi:hypothetical protein
MLKADVIDPTKVVRIALEYAASIEPLSCQSDRRQRFGRLQKAPVPMLFIVCAANKTVLAEHGVSVFLQE